MSFCRQELFTPISLASKTTGKSLLPDIKEPYFRALVRLQCDHINRSLVPSFYRYLQAQDEEAIVNGAKEFTEALNGLTNLLQRAEKEAPGTRACGLWEDGGELNLTDVMAGPC